MDFATIIGIGAGMLLIGSAIASKPGALMFINIPSMVIVIGGTLAATLVNFPMKDFLGMMKIVNKAFTHKMMEVNQIITNLVSMSRKARVEGLLSLEKDINGLDDEFLKKGLQLMVDGTEADMLRDIMSIELSYLEDRHIQGQDMLKAMAAYAPAFGMAGTLIGLIQMLQQLNDPSQIGGGMATALITTFYGVILANLFCIPLAGKLKTRTKMEVLGKELIIEGICSIQAGDNPRLLQDKLITFIAPKHRQDARASTEEK